VTIATPNGGKQVFSTMKTNNEMIRKASPTLEDGDNPVFIKGYGGSLCVPEHTCNLQSDIDEMNSHPADSYPGDSSGLICCR
jgi:hypothetical protein